MKKLLISVLTALLLIALLAVPAVAAEDETSTTASVTVGDVVSITIAGGLNFGSIAPGSDNVDGALAQTAGNPAIEITIVSETNVQVDVGITGNVTSGSLALSNWKYSTQFDKSDIASLTGPATYVEVYSDQGPSGSDIVLDFYHWISVPDGTTAGTHTVEVSYKATSIGFP